MKNHIIVLLLVFSIFSSCKMDKKVESNEISTPKQKEWALVIHGGAGYIKKDKLSPEKEKAYNDKLNEVLTMGELILKNGGTSLDAVEQCIKLMENSPLFNAGKGAVFTHEGKNEMDASIMDGSNLNAGAVAGVGNVKNPISAARSVMEQSKHVLLARKGAEQFAKEQGLDIVDPSYFFVQERFNSLKRAIGKDSIYLDHDSIDVLNRKFGTVGVVALDKDGNLAAGTSTGGMTNKQWGRIGDSPIIGAGTYANNETCGVSSTGHGEFFIRTAVAYDISALMMYKELSVEDAANEVIMKKLVEIGGDGGIVALDKYGNYAMPFNTEGMFRGYISSDDEPIILMYKDEE